MFEAVGEKFWPAYFRILRERLRPGARALVQTITIDNSHFAAYRATSDFIREFIFPGGMLPSPQRFTEAARRCKLVTRTSLAFGRDYGRPCAARAARFEAQLDTIRAQGFRRDFRAHVAPISGVL